MEKLLCIIIFFLFTINPLFSQENTFTLRGVYVGDNKAKIVLRYTNSTEKEIIDTVNVTNGKFLIKGNVSFPSFAEIRILNEVTDRSNHLITFFIEKGIIRLVLFEKKPSQYTISGSATQKILEKLRAEQKSTFLVWDSIHTNYLKMSMQRLLDKKVLELRYNKQRDSIFHVLSVIERKYIYNNINSFFGAYFLNYHLDEIGPDSLKLIYKKWPRKVKNSRYGKSLLQEIFKRDRSSLHNEAPDFKAVTITGDTIQLSHLYNEKVVLIDFWASWCIPCRESFNKLKESISKFSSDSIVVVAISTDTNEESWKKAIAADQTSSWIHILANQEKKENYKILFNYRSSPIPLRYLIIKGGVISNQWIGQNEQNDNELDNALKRLLNNDAKQPFNAP